MVKKGGKFMSDSWNNVKAVCCKPWLVLPTVYSDALSYGEQLDKFCYSLNKLIENNNILPDFIADKIKEYISSGAIGEVVQEILANYILNVKYPPKGITPAVGDGSADDTEAIQGCIDYASANGGVVYFPYGSYLTQPLTMKSGVSLFGFDRYSTKVVLKGGATKALLNGNGNNFSVCKLTLDGNSGIQVNDVNVVDMTGSNLMFNDLIIKDGYKLFNFVGDGHLQLSNIVFGNAVENCFSVDGNVIVQTNNLLFTALSKVGGVSVVDIRANGGNYDFNSVAKCDTCMLISGNDNKVVAMIGGAAEDYVDTGEHNNIEIVGHSQKEYYSGDVKKDANNSETTLQGTRSLHVVGASTFAVDGNSTESVDGNKSEIVTGVTSETYKNTKTTNLTNEDKTITGKKTTNANKLSETISNERDISAESNIETYANSKTNITNKYEGTVHSGELTVEENTFPITFPNKIVDLYNIGDIPTYLYTPTNPNDIGVELNALLQNYNVVMSPGKYKTATPIFVPIGKTLNGNNSTISGTPTDYLLTIGDDPTKGDTNYPLTGIYFVDLDCNNSGSGILINSKRANIQNVKIKNSSLSGIDVFKPDYSGSPSDARLQNIDIYKDDGASFSKYGIRFYGSDNNVNCVRTLFTQVGFYISDKGASCFFNDCHPLAFSSEIDGWLDSIGWDDYSGTTFISNCYADNFCTCYKLENTNSKLSIMGLKYFCWEYNRTTTRTFLSLNSGCFVNALGLDAPFNANVKKVDFPTGYYYLGNDRINLSFVSANEPSIFNESDYGNYSLYRYYKSYFKAFDNSTTTWHLIGVAKLLQGDMMASTINITADEFSIQGVTIYKGGFLNPGIGTNKNISLQLRKQGDDANTNTIYLYVKYEDGWCGRCLCEVNNSFLMLPRLWNPSTEPQYILATETYKKEA